MALPAALITVDTTANTPPVTTPGSTVTVVVPGPVYIGTPAEEVAQLRAQITKLEVTVVALAAQLEKGGNPE